MVVNGWKFVFFSGIRFPSGGDASKEQDVTRRRQRRNQGRGRWNIPGGAAGSGRNLHRRI